MSSSETASTPRVPKRSSASARMRSRVVATDACLPFGRDVLEHGPVVARSIPEALAGRRIAITGSTGFVGTALVERLLRGVPGCELVLLVRDGKRAPATRRVER